MLCGRYKKLLMPYMEGALSEGARRKIEAHLSRCRSCASELEMLRPVCGALRSADVPAMEPAPDLWARVSAQIEAENPRPAPRPWLRVTQAASACAAALLIAVVGIGMFAPDITVNHRKTPPPSPPVETREPGSRPVPPSVMMKQPAEKSPARLGLFAYRPHARPKAAASERKAVRLLAPPEAPSARTAAPAPASKPVRGIVADDVNYDYAGVVERTESPSVDRGRAPEAASPAGEVLAGVGYSRAGSESGVAGRALALSSTHDAPAPAATPAPERRLGVSRDANAGTAVVGDASTLGRSDSYFSLDGEAAKAIKPPSTTTSWHLGSSDADGSAPALTASLGSELKLVRNDGKPGSTLADGSPGGRPVPESVVDALNKTEGVHVVALFAYP